MVRVFFAFFALVSMACATLLNLDDPLPSPVGDAGQRDAPSSTVPFCSVKPAGTIFCDDFASAGFENAWTGVVGFKRDSASAQADGTGSMRGLAASMYGPSAMAKVPTNSTIVDWTHAEFQVRLSNAQSNVTLVDLDLTDSTDPCKVKVSYRNDHIYLENGSESDVIQVDLTEWTRIAVDLDLDSFANSATLTVSGSETKIALPDGCTEKSIKLLAIGSGGDVFFDNVLLSDPQ
jgi:hypothetical protein